ncbi:hypothetical protein DC498_10895 [Terrimonas sp.]|uniref:hypothetical protein n=1 Tax=Terrimonas sp. TaxID=1914338 RepID=UPI000D518A66|nr:hypothetical protein [Terrimonas sp.]PVD52222.1 hypothetical protein DC498_10895 [Terrimonas sp.]
MAKEENETQYKVIRLMFQSFSIKRMKDIEKLYPTMIAKALGINHSRYIQKLYRPDEFSIKHVIDLANLLDIEPQLIIDVILKELNYSSKTKKNNYK